VQNLLRTVALLVLKVISRAFYSHDIRWLDGEPNRHWDDIRILVFLNHTSLYEWLFAGSAPNRLLRRIATSAYIPVADITIERPFYGRFLKTLAPKFVSITREPDHTWQAVLDTMDEDSMVIIFPEGRMKRANGLDKHGNPMTVRGGISDLLRALPDGRMMLAYSGGLHHVQVPGQKLPKLFRKIRISFEFEDIERYRNEMLAAASEGADFKKVVKLDLEQRRDLHCGDGAPEQVSATPDSGS